MDKETKEKMKRVLKIVSAVVIVLAIVVIGGFTYLYNNGLSGMSANTEAKDGQIKVACVGDSITYGYGIVDWKTNNYPAVLQELLGEKYHVANFGSSGACVNPNGSRPYAQRAVYQESLDYDADILVFMLGTNDSIPENWTDTETFMKQYIELLNTYLKGGNPPKVYIALCAEGYWLEETDSPLAEFGIQPTVVDEIAAAIQNTMSESGYEIIDIRSLTTAHPEWFEKDGIHPDNDGAKGIAEAVAEAITAEKE